MAIFFFNSENCIKILKLTSIRFNFSRIIDRCLAQFFSHVPSVSETKEKNSISEIKGKFQD